MRHHEICFRGQNLENRLYDLINSFSNGRQDRQWLESEQALPPWPRGHNLRNNLDVAEIKAASPQKKPQAGYTLGAVWSLLPHLGF